MIRRILPVVLLIIMVFISTAFARESTYIEPEETWDPPSPGPLNAWSAPLLEAGTMVVQPLFYYNRARGIFNETGSYKSFVDGEKFYQNIWDLVLYYGVTDKLEIDFEGFYYQNYAQAGPDINWDEGRIGDSYIYARYCLMEEKDKHWMPCVTAMAQMKFPTGSYQKFDPDKLGTDMSGTGSYDQGYGVVLTKRIKPFILHADFVYNIPVHVMVDGIKTNYADYINLDFAVEYILPKGFSLLLEANYLQQGDMKLDGDLAPASDTGFLQLVPGIGWSCKHIRTLFCYQRTIAGTNTDVYDSFACTAILAF